MQLAFTHLRWAVASSLTKQEPQPIAIEGEMNTESYIWETINRGYDSLITWAVIHHDRKLPLVRAHGRLNGHFYVDRLLTQQGIPYIRNNR